MKTVSLAVAILLASISIAYAGHTEKEHTDEYVESEKLVEINANESNVSQHPSSVKKDFASDDKVDEAGLIYSEDDPYKDLDF